MKNRLQFGPWWFFICLQLGFVVLYVLAYHFRLERTQFEAAGELFNVINNEDFFILENGRFTVCLSQLLPLLAVKIKAPLDAVIALYSLNHVCFFHLVGLFAFLLGNKGGAALALFIPISGFVSSFFLWPYAELLYGFGLIIVWDTIGLMSPKTILKRFIMLVLAFFVFTSHPLCSALFIGVFVFRKSGSSRLLLKTIPVIVIALFVNWAQDTRSFLYLTDPTSYYQSYDISDALRQTVYQVFSTPVEQIVALIAIISVLFSGLNSKTKAVSVGAVFIVLHLMIIAGLGEQGTTPLYESSILMYGLFVFVGDNDPFSLNEIKPIVLTSLFLISVVSITENGDWLSKRSERLGYLCSVISSTGYEAVYIPEDDSLLNQFIALDYSSQPESILFSSLSTNTVSIISERHFCREQLLTDPEGSNCKGPAGINQQVVNQCTGAASWSWLYSCHKALNSNYFRIPSGTHYENLASIDIHLNHE